MQDQLFNINEINIYYEYLFLALITIFTIRQINQYKLANFDLAQTNMKRVEVTGFVLCVFFSFLIGLRPLGARAWLWGDTVNYVDWYNVNAGIPFQFDRESTNKIWDNLLMFWASNSIDISYFFLICDAIYFGATYMACKKWFQHDTTVAYLAFLGAFSTYSYSWNGVKAGVAAALFLVAIAYYERKWFSIIFLLLSLGFHHSMQLPIGAYILTLFFKNPKYYFYGWVFCVVMAVLHIGFFQSLFAGWSDEGGAGYLQGAVVRDETMDRGGFRPDFLLYSAVPVWFGWRLVMKEGRAVSREYLTLLYMYLTTNGVWCLCMYASFTNRIAYLSWFMYPFVLLYPFLKEDLTGSPMLTGRRQYDFMTIVVKYHLYFTLFMDLIFYKFIHPSNPAA